MKKHFSALFFMVASSFILLPGCVIVKPAAKSIVTIKRADDFGQQRTFGLRNGYWAEDENGIHIAANGWHPREHETYCFFISEPYYANLFRKVVLHPIRNDPQGTIFKLDVQLSGAYVPTGNGTDYDFIDVFEYEAQANVQVQESLNVRSIRFSDIKLYPKDNKMPVLVMEGKIIAQSDANNAYQSVINSKHQ